MKSKYLQVRKENIFTRFVNFIKKIFGKKVEQELSTQAKTPENKNVKSNFFDEIRINKEEDKELIELQNKYENNELDLAVLSDEEIDELNSLYKRQVSDLKKKLDDKKTELAIMKKKIETSSENM